MIFKIDDGCVDCHVHARSSEEAQKLESVKEYLSESERPLGVVRLAPERTIDIDMEGVLTISHTVEEWDYIYEGHAAFMLCSSEY